MFFRLQGLLPTMTEFVFVHKWEVYANYYGPIMLSGSEDCLPADQETLMYQLSKDRGCLSDDILPYIFRPPALQGRQALTLPVWQTSSPTCLKVIVRVFEVGSYKVHSYSRSVPYCNHQLAQPQFGESESCSSPDAQLCTAVNKVQRKSEINHLKQGSP